jgi:2,4-dienoyl-CoA reductase-like NADH-dependent reductase (Old Yellow Enzyme family)
MAGPLQLVRLSSFKTVEAFRAYAASLEIELPCDDSIVPGNASPLAQPVESLRINGKRVGNRYAIQPMEGWDGTVSGGATEHIFRRWRRFGESGAKLICGCEAMAVRPDARANPNQLIINDANKAGLAKLRAALCDSHRERHGRIDDLVIGFQLTHSGRFCRPTDKARPEPRVAYRHPILDRKFNVTGDGQVLTDAEVDRLIEDYVRAARIAWDVGADFVDLKHCHGYLLHEFLSAFHRPGNFGGSFENRTRILREIVAGIRADSNPIELAVRVSAFDLVPFKPDPALSSPGKPGSGIPDDYSRFLPYEYAFGVNAANPIEPNLTETFKFLELCAQLGVKIVNLSAGSPYYNPHIQRPAAYPPSDGYQPPEDPLIGVARQINVVRQLRARADRGLVFVGSAYSYLQEYLPHVAQYVVREGWVDIVGIGRMVLSYPEVFTEALRTGALNSKLLCRTFSDCTTAPRNGLISGCYPLDRYYANTPEAARLKEVKKAARGEA